MNRSWVRFPQAAPPPKPQVRGRSPRLGLRRLSQTSRQSVSVSTGAPARRHSSTPSSARLAWEPVRAEQPEYFVPYPIEFLRHSNDQHRALVDALERRHPVAAVDITRQHVARCTTTCPCHCPGGTTPGGAAFSR
ncbi:FCD domain-containing protein [Agromyces sp. ZXT2-6]|uniref:FCD domain-containing protein n=1 Tax=Agromyces sp. ZXT2-6 TaxID=3461153 RepID=UPI004054B0A0